MSQISRHYVSVDGRAVHYRVAGSGPLLLLLHQSPQSSADFLDLMARWSDRFTMICPDRPGCGCSDPLAIDNPGFHDYVDALVAFLDAMKLGRVAVYGFHTGASEALALADRHPDRVIAIASNGIVALTAEELADVDAHYLPPFVPQWDGSHLAWLWSRIREQTIFFPWHRRTTAARMKYDVPSPDRLQKNVMELLRCSTTYHLAYRAAFHFDPHAPMRRLRVPMLLTAAAWDPLASHLARLPATHPRLTVQRCATAPEAESLCADFLEPYAPAAPGLPVPTFSNAGGLQLLLDDEFTLHAREWGDADDPLVVVLHDAGERALTIEPFCAALATLGLRVLAPDLPGHGESSSPGALANDVVDHLAGRLALALRNRVHGPVTFLGLGAGAHVALSLASQWRGDVVRTIAHMPCAWPEASAAEIAYANAQVPTPDWFGGHLQYTWQRARSAGLFHPWCLAKHSAAWTGEPSLEPRIIHERAVALLLSGANGPALAAAAVREELGRRLKLVQRPVTVTIDPRAPALSLETIRTTCATHSCACVETGEANAGNAAQFSQLLRPSSLAS